MPNEQTSSRPFRSLKQFFSSQLGTKMERNSDTRVSAVSVAISRLMEAWEVLNDAFARSRRVQ